MPRPRPGRERRPGAIIDVTHKVADKLITEGAAEAIEPRKAAVKKTPKKAAKKAKPKARKNG